VFKASDSETDAQETLLVQNHNADPFKGSKRDS